MRDLDKLESSALIERLTHSTDREILALATTVQSVATQAAALLSTVVVDMPLYTLHNERHILNVIGWMEPPPLSRYRYDLCFPMTAIPLGRLRRESPAWRADRRYRPLGVLPFLMPELAEEWQKHAERLLELFPIGEMYALQPAERLWYKPFAEWTPADWQHPAHRSLLWDIGKGIVLAAPGVHPRDAFPAVGQPFLEFG